MKNAALAGRMSQADKKGWKESMKNIDNNISKVLSPPKNRPRIQADDKSLAAFFGQIANLPKPKDVQAQINSARKQRR